LYKAAYSSILRAIGIKNTGHKMKEVVFRKKMYFCPTYQDVNQQIKNRENIMPEQCAAAGLPVPIITNKGSDFWITFRRNIYNAADLKLLGLNERQIKAALYVKEKGKITNGEYQKLNRIGKSVTTDELHNLVERQILSRVGETGRGTFYELKKQNR
jgi:hypothetical protein